MKKKYTFKDFSVKDIINLKTMMLLLMLVLSLSSIAQCNVPTNFQVLTRTSYGGTVTWDAPTNPDNASYYHYRISTVPIAPATGQTTSFADLTITGYNPNTRIYVYVATRCSDGSVSAWTTFSFWTLAINGGCPTAPYGLYPTETFTPTFSSTPDVITTNAYAGHYSKVNIIENRQYIFNSSVASDYITITNSSGTTILAHGPAPLTWIAQASINIDVINFYITTNISCDTEAIGRTKTIKGGVMPGCNFAPTQLYASSIQSTSAILNWGVFLTNSNMQYYMSTSSTTPNVNQIPSGNNNNGSDYVFKRITGLLPSTTYYFWIRKACNTSGLWSEWVPGDSFTTQAAEYEGCPTLSPGQDLTTTFVPGCFGNQEIISTSFDAGEYNVVRIQKNKTYTFYSSVLTDFITIRSEDGYVIASGTTPLVWSSGDNAGDCKIYMNTSKNCGIEFIDRTQSIKCTDANISCDAPNAFTIISITGTTANVSWVGANHTPSNGYQYYVSTTNTTPVLNTPATGSTVSTNLTLLNLNPNTTYYIWVRSNCGASKSSWVFGNNFTTVGLPNTGCTFANGVLPSTTFTPSCFGNTETILTNAITYQYSNVTLTANTRYTFTTDLFGSSYPTADFITITNADASQIYVVGTTPLVWDSGTNSGVMRYYINANFACGYDSNYRIKSISCTPTPNCNAPTSLTSASITSNSATISWAASSPIPSSGYQYYISTSNTAPTTATTPSGSASGTSVVINGLNTNTLYYVWVRSNCGTSTSSWSNNTSFTTTIPAPTGCTTATYGLYPDATFTPTCSGTAEIIVSDAYTSEYSSVTISPNTNYTFSSSVPTDFITISNAFGTTVYTSGITPLVWSSGTNTGTIRYYFHSNSNCEGIDIERTKSITCSASQACNSPTNVATSNITNISAQLSWTGPSPAPSSGYDVYFSTTNSVSSATVPSTTLTGTMVNLTGLTPLTTYFAWVRSKCGTSTSNWVAVASFTTAAVASGGCTTDTYGLYPDVTFTPSCTDTAEIIATDSYASEYSSVTISPNTNYTFSSSVATDYITITSAFGDTVYTSGTSPLVWNSGTNTGTIRYYFHTNSSCGSEAIDRTKSITCTSSQSCAPPSNLTVSNLLTINAQLNWNAASPAPASGYDVYFSTTNSITAATTPVGTVTGLVGLLGSLTPGTTYYFWVRSNCGTSNVSSWVAGPSFTTAIPTGPSGCVTAIYGFYPETAFTSACSGTNEVIATDAYASEYSNINIVANKQYTFTSSVATDFITISNANATVIYASGVTPLVWNSGTNTGVIHYYLHTNSACGDADVNRTKSISCQDGTTPCNTPSNLTVSNIFTTNAQFNWNAASPVPASGYDLHLSLSSTISPTAVPFGTVTDLFGLVGGLSPGTTYYFWVRSNCGTSNVSSWVSGGSFTTSPTVSTGCITATYALYPEDTFTPNCSGTAQQIVIDAYAGEYTNVSVVNNINYTFSSSTATDFITITNNDASVIYTSGLTPLTWNSSAVSGIIRYYIHTNDACGEQNVNRTKFISCPGTTIPCAAPSNLTFSNITPIMAQVNWSAASPVPTGYNVYYSTINNIALGTVPSTNTNSTTGNMIDLLPSTTYYVWVRSYCSGNGTSSWISAGSFTTLPYTGVGCISSTYGLYPDENFIPACSGLPETIVTNAYAGEYSSVAVIQNMQYTFSSSVTTDFITITDATASVVYANGQTPLVWDSNTIQENIRYLIHTNSDCAEEEIDRTKSISCTTQLSNPNLVKTFARIYPNPTTTTVNIIGENNFDTIVILNSLGQIIKEFATHSNEIQVDLSNYASGVYFVKVFIADANQTYKLVKE